MTAAEEREFIVAWLRTTPRACGVLLSIDSSQTIARLADAIERGEHDPGRPVAEPCGGWTVLRDGAFASPFGTIRKCIDCGCLVAGGPTRCGRCARDAATDP
jgi:hypothetical protein